MHLWEAFNKLSEKRQSVGGMGGEIKPISYCEIESFSKLYKKYLLPSEIKIIDELDKVYLKSVQDGLSKSTN